MVASDPVQFGHDAYVDGLRSRPPDCRLTRGRRLDAQTLYDLYRIGLWVQVGLCGAAGVWALAAHQWDATRHRSLWWLTVLAYVVVTTNVVIASILLANFDWQFPELHMLYEFSNLVAIGIVVSYAKQLRGRQYLIYGFGSLFVMGLALRALFMG